MFQITKAEYPGPTYNAEYLELCAELLTSTFLLHDHQVTETARQTASDPCLSLRIRSIPDVR